jgi:hypothetical protein
VGEATTGSAEKSGELVVVCVRAGDAVGFSPMMLPQDVQNFCSLPNDAPHFVQKLCLVMAVLLAEWGLSTRPICD